jgi:hypothetical protein
MQPSSLIVLGMEALVTLPGASFYVEPYNLNGGSPFKGPADKAPPPGRWSSKLRER